METVQSHTNDAADLFEVEELEERLEMLWNSGTPQPDPTQPLECTLPNQGPPCHY